MKHILIVGSQHGNELLGEQLYAYLCKQKTASQISYYLANPRAHSKGLRYIESDMNRSYLPGNSTYEAGQAQELLRFIGNHNFDLILDAHTTTVNQMPCLIVAGITGKTRPFLGASHVQNVVVMKHQFVEQSLIGHVPQAISLEISNRQLGPALFRKLFADLTAYSNGQKPHPEKTVFTVEDVLHKRDAPAVDRSTLRNFERSVAGFYPVLMGEEAYKKQTDYLGFLARDRQTLRL